MTEKRKIANKLARGENVGRGVFESKGWILRKAQKALKVIKRVKRATIRRLEREIAKDKGVKVVYSIK